MRHGYRLPDVMLITRAIPPCGDPFPPWRRQLQIKTQKKNDRHRDGSVQLKVWLPDELKNEFASVCAVQGVCASVVLRGLLTAYVQQISGWPHGSTTKR